MVAPPGALRWATRRASFVVPGGFGAVVFEFLRLVPFAAGDTDFFLNGLLVMVFSPDVAAQVGAATGASPGWPGVDALTLLCAGKSSAFARYSATATARPYSSLYSRYVLSVPCQDNPCLSG